MNYTDQKDIIIVCFCLYVLYGFVLAHLFDTIALVFFHAPTLVIVLFCVFTLVINLFRASTLVIVFIPYTLVIVFFCASTLVIVFFCASTPVIVLYPIQCSVTQRLWEIHSDFLWEGSHCMRLKLTWLLMILKIILLKSWF